MAKYFQRIGTEKKNFSITAKIISMTSSLKDSILFTVQWKRGPQTEET
jgi:hypothetical protein